MLASLKHEISLLQQQVDFLIRNGRPLGLLDLDVMMNRTHTIYDKLCSINLGDSPIFFDEDEDLPGVPEEESPAEKEEEELPEEQPAEEEALEEELMEEKPVEQPMEEELLEEENPIEEEEPLEEEPIQEEAPVEEEEPLEEEPVEEENPIEETPLKEEEPFLEPKEKDDFGFILNFEPAEPAATEETPSVFTTGDEIEMTIPHIDLPLDENPEEPEPEEQPLPYEPDENIAYEPVIFGKMEDSPDDTGFEFETPETLADKLQNRPVQDLRTAIGINDKFLMVNELFGGNMEKYHRSIENLNDLKTLNGALIYMNELRIELQWNSNNEAYKKLLDIVHRKFED